MQIDQAINALQDIVKALHDADGVNIALVSATLSLVIVTIFFGLWDRSRQNKEHFERVRPWITIEGAIPVQVIHENGDADTWNNFMETPIPNRPKITHVVYDSKFTNTGISIAHDLQVINIRKDEPITKEELQNQQEKIMHLALTPNQSRNISLKITSERWLEITTKPLYIGIQISYFNGKTRSQSGIISKVIRGQIEAVEMWYM